MKKARINVTLTDREVELIKAMQNEGIYGSGVTFNKVMECIFYLQLREDMDTIGEELLGKEE